MCSTECCSSFSSVFSLHHLLCEISGSLIAVCFTLFTSLFTLSVCSLVLWSCSAQWVHQRLFCAQHHERGESEPNSKHILYVFITTRLFIVIWLVTSHYFVHKVFTLCIFCLLVCVFLCKQDYTITTKQVSMKRGGRMWFRSGKNPFNFSEKMSHSLTRLGASHHLQGIAKGSQWKKSGPFREMTSRSVWKLVQLDWI